MQVCKRQDHVSNVIEVKKHAGCEPLKFRACAMESKRWKSTVFALGCAELFHSRRYLLHCCDLCVERRPILDQMKTRGVSCHAKFKSMPAIALMKDEDAKDMFHSSIKVFTPKCVDRRIVQSIRQLCGE